MLYQVYQITFTNAQIDEINGSSEMPDFYSRYLRVVRSATEDVILDAIGQYRHVADVEADNLEHAFHVSNVGTLEHRINRHHGMHSVSVGDVIVDPDGFAHAVAPYGFNLLPHVDKNFLDRVLEASK
jgi:hypothetical protein